jgi:hypothetical protein
MAEEGKRQIVEPMDDITQGGDESIEVIPGGLRIAAFAARKLDAADLNFRRQLPRPTVVSGSRPAHVRKAEQPNPASWTSSRTQQPAI